jgi:hypothetical protein
MFMDQGYRLDSPPIENDDMADTEWGGLRNASDVRMYSFNVRGSAHLVEFYATSQGAVQANYAVRLFNSRGEELVPGTPGRAYLQPGTYFVGVSLSSNRTYNPWTGSGLVGSGQGNWQFELTVVR